MSFIYAGPEADARKYSQPFKDIGTLGFTENMYSWAELPYQSAGGLIAASCQQGSYKNTYSNNMALFDIPTMRSTYTAWGNL